MRDERVVKVRDRKRPQSGCHEIVVSALHDRNYEAVKDCECN